MDRIEFSKSLNVDTVTQVENIFDEVMAMYNLVGGDYVSIHGTAASYNSVSFSVTFINQQKADHIQAELNDKAVAIYGSLYNINSVQDESDSARLDITISAAQ